MKNLFYTALIGFSIISCNAQETNSDAVILIIAGEEITKAEFERVYYKNNTEDVTEQALQEYLQLYINFKLKVKEAEELKMDTSDAFKKELQGYRRQLATAYLTDKKKEEAYLREAYEMYKVDINASQIFISVPQKASPADTVLLYDKIHRIYAEYKAGTSFDELVVANTDNEETKASKGNIGFRSAADLFYPFSKAIFYKKDGDVVAPIRTKYGYHIIRLEGRRPSIGKIRVAHILIRFDKAGSEAAAETTIKLHSELLSGADFSMMAEQNSHDKKSSLKGGDLKMFGAGRMYIEFENAAFALKEDNEISEPIKTSIGWHIIKRLEKKEIEEYDNVVHILKKKISNDNRARKIKDSYMTNLLAEFQFVDKLSMRNDFYKILDESFTKRKWNIDKAAGLNGVMFSLRGKDYTQQDFAKYIVKHQRRSKNFMPKRAVNMLYNSYVKESCMNVADKMLASKYPDFRSLMKAMLAQNTFPTPQNDERENEYF